MRNMATATIHGKSLFTYPDSTATGATPDAHLENNHQAICAEARAAIFWVIHGTAPRLAETTSNLQSLHERAGDHPPFLGPSFGPELKPEYACE
jgi:hypothetical protein